jgi:1,4-dihydroxy-2-naphthoyl-CoA hydrolase
VLRDVQHGRLAAGHDVAMRDDAATEFLHTAMPFCGRLGFDVETMLPAEVVLAVDWSDDLCTTASALHGGLLMALADSAGGACAFANLPAGAVGTSTIESKTNFLGPARRGRFLATARPLHIGGTTIVVETEVRDEAGKLITKTTQTQVVLRPK